MSERPIRFTGPEVRAALDDIKTQKRLVCKHEPLAVVLPDCRLRGPQGASQHGVWSDESRDWWMNTFCPYRIGDTLWVRETWGKSSDRSGVGLVCYFADNTAYRMLCEDNGESDPVGHEWKQYTPTASWDVIRRRPSIHMPRWASRITLEITGVRVERVQAITEEDAKAEGAEPKVLLPGEVIAGWTEHKLGFAFLWDSINGKRGPKHSRRRAQRGKPVDHWKSTQAARVASGAYAWAANPWVWVLEFRRVTQ
jgi:hypothetical protein